MRNGKRLRVTDIYKLRITLLEQRLRTLYIDMLKLIHLLLIVLIIYPSNLEPNVLISTRGTA